MTRLITEPEVIELMREVAGGGRLDAGRFALRLVELVERRQREGAPLYPMALNPRPRPYGAFTAVPRIAPEPTPVVKRALDVMPVGQTLEYVLS